VWVPKTTVTQIAFGADWLWSKLSVLSTDTDACCPLNCIFVWHVLLFSGKKWRSAYSPELRIMAERGRSVGRGASVGLTGVVNGKKAGSGSVSAGMRPPTQKRSASLGRGLEPPPTSAANRANPNARNLIAEKKKKLMESRGGGEGAPRISPYGQARMHRNVPLLRCALTLRRTVYSA
jgi:hypothetical protein